MASVVAITGASGLIGRHLCEYFRGRGYEVRALVRHPEAFSLDDIRVYACDLPERIDPDALRGANVLIHCAYATRAADAQIVREVNEQGTRRVREEAQSAHIAKFVFVSSIAAAADGPTYYARSKYQLEQLQDPGRDLNLRPGLVLARDGGLFARLADWVRRMPVIPLFGGGRQMMQTVHIDDLCTAVESALTLNLAGVLTVAHPRAIAFRDLLLQVAELSGRRSVLAPIPIKPALWALEALERLPVKVPVSADNLRGLLATRQVDTSRDLARLRLQLRGPRESLADLFGESVNREHD